MRDGPRVLRENVKDTAVTTHEGQLFLAAFVDGEHAWFFSGEEELASERVELGAAYGGGGRLIADNEGVCHLFYLAPQLPGSSFLLRHLRFAGQWSKPQTVSTNVAGDPAGFSACWHGDGYLHLAYLGHKDRYLLYRVFDLKHGVWSGAINFSEGACSHPQFLPGKEIHLFWLEELDHSTLKVKSKREQWSQAVSLSTGRQHAGPLGFNWQNGNWQVLWGEGGDLYQVPLGRWEERNRASREDFDYIWRVHSGLTLPMYRPKDKPQPAPTALRPAREEQPLTTDSLEKEQARRRREEEQAQAQAAFMEQAFRTLREWEELREDLKKWRNEWRNSKPEVVDLTPLTARLDRLERRLFTLRQTQDEEKNRFETARAQLERELAQLRSRLSELESQQKAKPRGLLWRVLGRP